MKSHTKLENLLSSILDQTRETSSLPIPNSTLCKQIQECQKLLHDVQEEHDEALRFYQKEFDINGRDKFYEKAFHILQKRHEEVLVQMEGWLRGERETSKMNYDDVVRKRGEEEGNNKEEWDIDSDGDLDIVNKG